MGEVQRVHTCLREMQFRFVESVTWVFTDGGLGEAAEGGGMLASHRSLYIFRSGKL